MNRGHEDKRREQLVEMVSLLSAPAEEQLKWLIGIGADPSELVAQYEDAAATWLPGFLSQLSAESVSRLTVLSSELERLKKDAELRRFATPDDGLQQAHAWSRVRTAAANALASISNGNRL